MDYLVSFIDMNGPGIAIQLLVELDCQFMQHVCCSMLAGHVDKKFAD